MAPLVTEGDSTVFSHFADEFNEVAASFFGELGNREADEFAIHLRSDAQLRFFESFTDGVEGGGVPGLNDEEARFGGGDTCELFEAHGGAIGFDPNVFNESGGGFAGANALEVLLHLVEGLVHFFLGFEEDIVGGHKGGMAKERRVSLGATVRLV